MFVFFRKSIAILKKGVIFAFGKIRRFRILSKADAENMTSVVVFFVKKGTWLDNTSGGH